MRVIQGLGAAACMSMARVIVNDSFQREEAAQKLSFITAVMVIFPNLALILGGIIADTIGWRGSMFTLGIFGLFLFLCTFKFIPETKPLNFEKFSNSELLDSYYKVISNKTFLNFTILGATQTAIFFSTFSFMPYEFDRMGISSTEFSIWLAFNGLGYFIGNVINSNYASKIGISKMVFIGCLGTSFAFGLMFVFHILNFKYPLFIFLPLFIFGFFNGITIANSIIGGISATGKLSGTATGIAGATQMTFTAILGSFIIACGGDESFALCIIIILILNCLAIYSSSVIHWNLIK